MKDELITEIEEFKFNLEEIIFILLFDENDENFVEIWEEYEEDKDEVIIEYISEVILKG